ncbi:MAG: hypothetical protein GOV00_03590 [Candidatus Altiarchaeota archaeon]|nr:hypothetical protein [Candidatus Altiarchaeota archaeon]
MERSEIEKYLEDFLIKEYADRFNNIADFVKFKKTTQKNASNFLQIGWNVHIKPSALEIFDKLDAEFLARTAVAKIGKGELLFLLDSLEKQADDEESTKVKNIQEVIREILRVDGATKIIIPRSKEGDEVRNALRQKGILKLHYENWKSYLNLNGKIDVKMLVKPEEKYKNKLYVINDRGLEVLWKSYGVSQNLRGLDETYSKKGDKKSPIMFYSGNHSKGGLHIIFRTTISPPKKKKKNTFKIIELV